MKIHPTLLGLISTLSFVACQTSPAPQALPAYTPDIAVTQAPYTDVTANWKQRLDQPYVYFDNRGDYRLAGQRFSALHEALQDEGVAASGPPFMLFYDDPAEVPLKELRSRVCLPVASAVGATDKFQYAVLPSTTVVYAVVAGPYPEAPRAYPGLYRYLESMHWVENGPLREIYLVRPNASGNWDELLCEIQIPATQRR